MSASVTLGNINNWTTQGEFNKHSFAIQNAISRLQTVTLVQVLSCSNSGGVSPWGTVTLQPLVNQVDGSANSLPLPILNNVPYFRLQGGTAGAVILDPAPGDIGIALFASRDISKVISTQAQANPGSFRQYDLADGLYIGGVLNGSPSQYLQFNITGITVVTPGKLATQSTGDTDITASGDVNVTASGDIVLSGASIQAGSSPVPVCSEPLVTWINAVLRPALVSASIVVAAPPADALTTTLVAS